MNQIVNNTVTFSDTTSPNNQVNAARLTAISNGASLLNGAVTDQANVSTRAGNVVPLAADMILLGDSTQLDTGVPLMVPVGNLLTETQRNGVQRWGGTAAGTNTLTITTSPASVTVGYVTGETVRFLTNTANTGAVTLNLDSRGAANLYSSAATALVSADLAAGALIEAVYDGTRFQIVSQSQVNSHQFAQSARGDCQQYAVATGTNSLTVTPLDSNGSATFTSYTTGMVVRFKNTTANTGNCTITVNGIAGAPALLYNGNQITPAALPPA